MNGDPMMKDGSSFQIEPGLKGDMDAAEAQEVGERELARNDAERAELDRYIAAKDEVLAFLRLISTGAAMRFAPSQGNCARVILDRIEGKD